jgi:ribosomal protein S18 acetylase RimI-like enzyme
VRGRDDDRLVAIELHAANKTSYLQEIGVLAAYRAQGLAGLLMAHGFRAVCERNVSRIGVGGLQTSRAAIRFFSEQGFQELYRRLFLRRGA